MGLVRSNKHKNWENADRPLSDFRPEKMLKAEDFEKKQPESVTFDTSIRITNHLKNKLQALILMGYTSTIKESIDLIFQNYRDDLDGSEKKNLDFQIKNLEQRDAKIKNR